MLLQLSSPKCIGSREHAASYPALSENEDGPTAVEYAVMLALIIVLCIVVIRQVGTSASATFSTSNSALS
ncbi:MAG TPA: Flp family type IVb pilin [Gemmatales bacterium]|nr:Flp family type IVb pilin [Gemmatales bacterium]